MSSALARDDVQVREQARTRERPGAHALDPLLRPRALALVGASERHGSVGRVMLDQARQGGFGGPLYPVNPRYQWIEGVACYPSLRALPEPVDHAVLALADERVEAAFEDAVASGARAVTIFSSLFAEEPGSPGLAERLRARAREAGVLVCGPMSMGLYNFHHGLWVCGFETRLDHRAGGVGLISQSGAVLASLVDAEARIDYGLVVSSGQEMNVTTADYLDFALQMPETRVVGLFLEAVRDPERFVACLENARRRRIPVVALKVGRTERSARLAESHSGALAGNDAAYQALFERYGVVRVATLDEMAHTLVLFAHPHPVGPGALATIHDSGGERGLLIDLADDIGVPFASLSDTTLEHLAARLDPGLPPGNPLDAWGTGRDYQRVFAECASALMADPATSVGAVVCDRGPDSRIFPEYADFVRAAHAASGKPVCLVSNHQGSGASPEAVALTRAGYPVLDGAAQFLRGVRHLFEHRDFLARADAPPPVPDPGLAQRWRARLAQGPAPAPDETLDWLEAFGVPAAARRHAGTRDAALAAAQALGYPVALKTAEPHVLHKTEARGVALDVPDPHALVRAYDDMAARLGPRVTVMAMVREGVELMLGLVDDAQFGPVVVLGAGGIYTEVFGDTVFALAPFDADSARRLVARLRVRPLLDGVRGAPPADLDALCEAAARFSAWAATSAGAVQSADLNPLMAHSRGCTTVDARIILHQSDARRNPS